MSPILLTTSAPTVSATGRALTSYGSTILSVPSPAVQVHKDAASLVPHAGSLLASLARADREYSDTIHPILSPRDIVPRYLPPTNQSTSTFSIGGLWLFGGIIFAIGFIVCSLILVSNFWGRWQQCKALAKITAGEDAQTSATAGKSGSDKAITRNAIENSRQSHTIDKCNGVEDVKDSKPAMKKDVTPEAIDLIYQCDCKDIVPVYQTDRFGTTGDNFDAEDGVFGTPVSSLTHINAMIKSIAFYDDPDPAATPTLEGICPISDSWSTECIAEEEMDITDATTESLTANGDVSTKSPTSSDADADNHRFSKDVTKLDFNSNSALDMLVAVLRESQGEDSSFGPDRGVCYFHLLTLHL